MEQMNTNTKEKVYFTNAQIEEYKMLIYSEYIEMRKLEEQILHHKKQLEKYKNILIANCDHHRVQDTSSCMYDKTTYHCDICNQDLWN